MSPIVEVVRTYLELRTPEQLRAADLADPRVRFSRGVSPAAYRHLYATVGGPWHWRDRARWSDTTLSAHLSAPRVHVWRCLVDDELAGFFELEQHDDDAVEIVYFGLVAPFIGRGLGKAMLTRAVREAWTLGASRVWLHTCTLDSPHALPNYKARGFEETGTDCYVVQIPDESR